MHGMTCTARRVRGTIGMQSREQLVAAMRQGYGYKAWLDGSGSRVLDTEALDFW